MWTVDKDELMAGLERVEAATDEKSPHPYVGMVLIAVADQAHLRLSTTNLQLAIETTVPAQVEAKVKFAPLALSHKRLRAVVGTMPGGPLKFQIDKQGRLQLKCTGQRQYALPTVPGADFPKNSVPSAEATVIELPVDLLVSSIERVRYAIPPIRDRAQLDGVHVEILSGKLSAVTMCGAMLAVWETAVTAPDAQLFVPAPVFKPLRLAASKGDEPLRVQVDPTVLFFSRGSVQIAVVLPALGFPPWRALLASLERTVIGRIPALPALDALRAVSTAAPGESVRLRIIEGGLEISVAKEECEARDVIPIETTEASELDVLVNPVYLIDTIKGANLNFTFERAADQLGVTTEEGFLGFLARVVR